MANYYASTTGSSGNPGTLAEPWDLESALESKYATVDPGDTIWVLAGTYVHSDRSQNSFGFAIRLYGSDGSPITVRPYPDNSARVILDGGLQAHTGAGEEPEYVWLMNLEVIVSEMIASQCYNHDSPRTTDTATSSNYISLDDQNFPMGGIDCVQGKGLKFIHCIVRGNGQGVDLWGPCADETEMYGCLVYDNGWIGPDRKHGHSVYMQNNAGDSTYRYIHNNMFFGGYGPSVLHLYGSGAATVNYFDIQRNISWWGCNPSIDEYSPTLRKPTGRSHQIGGENASSNLHFVFQDNFCFLNGVQFGYVAGGDDWDIRRNIGVFSHIGMNTCPDLLAPPYAYHRTVTSDETSPAWSHWSGTYASIDEDPLLGPSVDSDYITTDGADAEGTCQFGMVDTPDDFSTMGTSGMKYFMRVRNSGAGDDSTTLYIQIVKSDGSTALTNEMTVGTYDSSDAWQFKTGTFTGVQAANQTDWDGARVKLRSVYNRTDTHDSQLLQISALDIKYYYVSDTPADFNFFWRESGYTGAGDGYLEANPEVYPIITAPANPLYKLNPSTYDSDRAHFAGFGINAESTCEVDVSGWLSNGDTYELRDPANFWGEAVGQGTVSSGTINIPLDYDMPGWMDEPDFRFSAYVILKTDALTCSVGTVTVTGLQATVTNPPPAEIDCTAGAVAATGLQASVSNIFFLISCTLVAVTVSGLQVNVNVPPAVRHRPPTGLLGLGGFS